MSIFTAAADRSSSSSVPSALQGSGDDTAVASTCSPRRRLLQAVKTEQFFANVLSGRKGTDTQLDIVTEDRECDSTAASSLSSRWVFAFTSVHHSDLSIITQSPPNVHLLPCQIVSTTRKKLTAVITKSRAQSPMQCGGSRSHS